MIEEGLLAKYRNAIAGASMDIQDPIERRIAVVETKQELRSTRLREQVVFGAYDRDAQRLSQLYTERVFQQTFTAMSGSVIDALSEESGNIQEDTFRNLSTILSRSVRRSDQRGLHATWLTPDQLTQLSGIASKIESPEHQIYKQYINYVLWQAAIQDNLPNPTETKIEDGISANWTDECIKFRLEILPQVWEQYSHVDTPNVRQDTLRTNRTMSLIQSIEHTYVEDEFTRWRRSYRDTANEIGISVVEESGILALKSPLFSSVTDRLARQLRELSYKRKLSTLILGTSGHLDSGALLPALIDAIDKSNLPIQVQAFYMLETDPQEIIRLTDLVRFLQETYGERSVELVRWDMNNARELYVRTLHANTQQEEFDPMDYLKNPRIGSQSHALLVGIKGHMSQQYPGALTIGGQELSEMMVGNVTTTDTLIGWYPFGTIPKTVVRDMFIEFAEQSGGKIDSDAWLHRYRTRPNLPYYPSGIHVQCEEKGKTISRTNGYIPFFREAHIDPSSSRMPEQLIDSLRQHTDTRYAVMDVRMSYYLDPFFHIFMLEGVSRRTVDRLIAQYPEQESDICLAAMYMAYTRENENKLTRISRRIHDGFIE